MKVMNKKIGVGIVILILVIAGFFFLSNNDSSNTTDDSNTLDDKSELSLDAPWRNTVLEDINSGESYKISDFLGKVVLLESFAVWCPTCTKQQQEIDKFHYIVSGGELVSISLDTDPNEDKEKIEEHLERHGFNWRYSIAPVDLTRSLIDDFGQGVVNAPQAPVVLICENGSASQLPRGVKKAEELLDLINERCS